MTIQPQQETLYREAPATAAMSDKAHNIISMLHHKLESVWRCDEYIRDCGDDQRAIRVFQQIKEAEIHHVQMLRDEIELLCRLGQFR